MFQEIIDKVWFIPSKDYGKYPYSNSLFINDQKKLLIDTGFGKRGIKKLIKTFGEPDIILYSHAHKDHVPAENLFPTAKKYIHPNDKLMATSEEELYRIYGLSDKREFLKLVATYYKSFHYRPLTSVETFNDKQIFNLGSIQVKVLYSPGHSAGHCCFEILDESLVFSSDIDLTSFGPWYGGLDCDINDFKNSIEAVIRKSPKTILTSHKGMFQNDAVRDKLSQYLYKFQEREEKILHSLEKEQTLEELTFHALIHGKFVEPKEFFITAERIMLEKHLVILLETNKLELYHGRFRTL